MHLPILVRAQQSQLDCVALSQTKALVQVFESLTRWPIHVTVGGEKIVATFYGRFLIRTIRPYFGYKHEKNITA